jgi:DNA polymerase-1
MMITLDQFAEVWCIDFEFNQDGRAGNPPFPVCAVAQELHSMRVVRLWGDELQNPPFDLSAHNVLTVGFYYSAESGCMMELGWPRPANVLDLFAEFRCMTNGSRPPRGNGLLGACSYFGINTMNADTKHEMRDLILRGAPFTEHERTEILEYCAADVYLTCQLFAAMLPHLAPNWPHALTRGRYMEVLGRVEGRGVPIDTDIHARLVAQWDRIKLDLVEVIDRDYGVFDGTTFKRDLFEDYLVRRNIPWPRLESGALALDDDTFKTQARANAELVPLRELRHTLGQMRLNKLAVGADGRNRCLLSPFASKTGRNQPSNSKFIFGPSAWLRSLIKPPEGMALAYLDYARQEFGIAAAYSGDRAMQDVYRSEDPYISFAFMAGAVPEGASKQSHPTEREKFKMVALAVQYGMTSYGLRDRGNMTHAEARQLLSLHRLTFPGYWAWSDQIEGYGTLTRQLRTSLGWQIQYPGWSPVNLRSMRNWPVQSAGADMLRVAMIALEDAGIETIAPIHDACLIQAPLNQINDTAAEARAIMGRVSEQMLGGLRLDVDADLVCWPDRYVDGRGVRLWTEIMELLG